MCGLVGVAGVIDEKAKEMFKTMLVLDTLRGPHSTGVFTQPYYAKDGGCLAKAVGTPHDLFDTGSFDDAMVGTLSVMMGHNRFATMGKINKQNAHPFEFDTVVGAHNGTLRQQSLLDDHAMFKVDSENLYHHMNKNGVRDTIKKLNGAYALTWYDKVGDTINFCRNNERPLYYTFSQDRRTLMWASEQWMLTVAAGRHGMKINAIVEVQTGKLYTFGIPGTNYLYQRQAFNDITIVDVQTYEQSKKVVNIKPNRGANKTHNKSGSGNVDNAVGKRSVYDIYQEHMGKDVDIVVRGPKVDTGNNDYIDCELLDNPELNVRIYAKKDGFQWKQLVDSVEAWSGFTKRLNHNDGGYMVIDLNTLIEVPGLIDSLIEDEQDTIDIIYGHDNVKLSEEEYTNKTKCGCAWCADPVEVSDHSRIKWIDSQNFLCEKCAQDEALSETYL